MSTSDLAVSSSRKHQVPHGTVPSSEMGHGQHLLPLSQEGTWSLPGFSGHPHHSSCLQGEALSSHLFLRADEIADVWMAVNPQQRQYHFKLLEVSRLQAVRVILSARLKLLKLSAKITEKTDEQDILPFPEQAPALLSSVTRSLPEKLTFTWSKCLSSGQLANFTDNPGTHHSEWQIQIVYTIPFVCTWKGS